MIDTIIEERFRVSERVARQGAVELFEGFDTVDGRPVLIKRFGIPLSQDREFHENWRTQLVSLQGLNDGHVPRVYAFGRLPDSTLYQIEEPPHGVTLRRYAAARAPMHVAESTRLVATAARAVGVGHLEGMAHGGLTPETIFLEEMSSGQIEAFVNGWESGELVIALRTAIEPLPERLGRYLSPEQLGDLTPPATLSGDVYSLAVILYELLTGSLPTPHIEGDPLAARVVNEPIPARRFNPDIPTAVERVLLRALSRDPALRPANANAFASALSQALSAPEPAQPPPAPPPPPVVERRTVTVIRRSLTQPVLLALGLLSLCAVLTLLWLTRNPQPVAVVLTPTPEIQPVPNLVGPPYVRYNDALPMAWNMGYVTNIVGFREDASLPPGVVVAQCPAAGSLPGDVLTQCANPGLPPVAANSILVYVSSLPEPVVLRVVPDLYGQDEQQSRLALEAGDLRVGTRREAYDSVMPPGRVVEQNPRRGLAVMPGTAVDIIVSAGAPVTTDNIPLNPPPVSTPLPTSTLDIVLEPTETLPPPVTSTPSTTPAPIATATSEVQSVLLEDDFETGNSLGWLEEQSESVDGTITEGAFRVQLLEPPAFWQSGPGRLFADYSYGATVLIEPGSADEESGAGLTLRVRGEDEFYFFEINSTGQYRLRARSGDSWIPILDWEGNPAILPSGVPNQLQVRAEGERLTLFVNGSQVGVTDIPAEAAYLDGDIGLGVEAVNQAITATFDDVIVTTLTGGSEP